MEETIGKVSVTHFGFLAAIGAASLCATGCGVDDPVSDRQIVGHQAMVGGDARVRPGSEAVVLLSGGCSGVMINPHTIATVEHCIGPGSPRGPLIEAVDLEVRAGATSEICITSMADSQCGKWRLQVVRQPATDVILLQSKTAFSGVVPSQLPLVPRLPKVTSGYAHGFGVSSTEGLPTASTGIRLSAPVVVLHQDQNQLYGRAPANVSICGGDSGGPLFDDSQSPMLAGLLSATEYDKSNPECTSPNGLNRWSRIDSDFLAQHAGPCNWQETVLDCRNGKASFSAASVQAVQANTVPDVIASLREAGVSVRPRNSVDAASLQNSRLLSLSTSAGVYVVDSADLTKNAAALSPSVSQVAAVGQPTSAGFAGAPSGSHGEMVALSPRGLAISGGSDDRGLMFVQEVGGIRNDSSTGTTDCAGTLIGVRLVRTARHCLVNYAQPYFTLRYNGGPTTWTFDGGATWVTFYPRQAAFYSYPTAYDTKNCSDWLAGGKAVHDKETCTASDWALLVMSPDVWQPVHVIPRYMGYVGSSSYVTSVTDTGYPWCHDMAYANNVPRPCVENLMYGMFCSIRNNKGSWFYSDCDNSPGDSGGPVFIGAQYGDHWLAGNESWGPDYGGCSNAGCATVGVGTTTDTSNLQTQFRSSYSWYQL